MPLLTCEHICMNYDNQIAVQDVSFALEAGDYLCVVGENGTGKSTLMKGILGLLPLRSGSLQFDGLNSREIGYLPQQTVAQRDFPASVLEVVLSGTLARQNRRPFYSRRSRTLARENLQKLNIAHLAGCSYRDLSGGQQQRVLLARALCATDKLLVLDEPVTGLDPVVTADFYALIHQLNRQQGITVMMVSHDINSAVRYANKILHMDTTVRFFGNVADYLTTDAGKRMLGGSANA